MAKTVSKEHKANVRSKRAQVEGDKSAKANVPAEKARDIRNQHLRDEAKRKADEAINRANTEDEDDDKPKKAHVVGKPGSGAGLKPGDWFAPSSNPGAAARVPSQPLQPESKQSHGKGILYDKDLDNPPYDAGDPLETDAAPSGSGSPSNTGASRTLDKDAERKKAEKATARSKQLDPDNPTRGRSGRDATASPNPIGSHSQSKADVAGGSNSGTDEDSR